MGYTPLELAAAFIKTGELSDALDALNQQLQVEPHDQEARRLRAEVLARLSDAVQWREALDDLKALENPTPDDFTRQSALYLRLGETQAALATMQAALTAHAGNERLAELAVHMLQKQGDIEGALALVADQPRTWRWLQWSGDLAALSGNHPAALQAYSDALQRLEAHTEHRWVDAIRARLLLARADSQRQLNLLENAESDYQAAALLMPDDPVIPFNRGLIAAQRGDLDNAAALCREALAHASPLMREKMLVEVPPELAVLLSEN